MGYVLKDNDKIIAKVKGNEDNLKLVAEEGVGYFDLPYGLFGGKSLEVSMLEFVDWASTRCFPKERYGADKLLAMLELDFYDGFDIVMKTKGVLMTDNFSIDYIEEESD